MSPSEYLHQHPALQGLEPYLVAAPHNVTRFELRPFGLEIPSDNLIDPTRVDSVSFCSSLQTLDRLTFGPEGMPMDKWVFYDICYMPGGVFGFGLRASEAPEELRALFGDVEDDALLPLTMYGAIPMAVKGAWMGHNLCSLGSRVTGRNLRGLGTIAKAVGLKCFQSRQFYGATQWESIALKVHVKFGPLKLYTAYTPAHSEAHTLTYGFNCIDQALLTAMGHPEYDFERPQADFWVHSADEEAMIQLQDQIEHGGQFVIPFSPTRLEHGQSIPISILKGSPSIG